MDSPVILHPRVSNQDPECPNMDGQDSLLSLRAISVLRGNNLVLEKLDLDVYSGDRVNHAVDGISGATITSKGVSDFIKNDLKRYDEYFAENKID